MRRVLVAVLVLAAALLAPATVADAATGVRYAALGDSYSAGVGAPPPDLDAACLRSSRGYPPLWRRSHPVSEFDFLACSGATTSDVRATQVPALPADADLVTITIGGNDAGFARVLEACTFAATDDQCRTVVDAAETFIAVVISRRLARTYDAIHDAVPHARLVVLGYPRLFELTDTCANPLVPDKARRSALNQGADVLDETIRRVAARHNAAFADVRDRFAGHGVCSTDTPWINAPLLFASVGSYHPNATGYRSGYLPALNAVTG